MDVDRDHNNIAAMFARNHDGSTHPGQTGGYVAGDPPVKSPARVEPAANPLGGANNKAKQHHKPNWKDGLREKPTVRNEKKTDKGIFSGGGGGGQARDVGSVKDEVKEGRAYASAGGPKNGSFG